MGYKLSMSHPDYPKGTEFDVGGLLVPNGGSVSVSEEMEQALVSRHGAPVKEALGANPHLKVEGTTELSKPKAEGGEV